MVFDGQKNAHQNHETSTPTYPVSVFFALRWEMGTPFPKKIQKDRTTTRLCPRHPGSGKKRRRESSSRIIAFFRDVAHGKEGTDDLCHFHFIIIGKAQTTCAIAILVEARRQTFRCPPDLPKFLPKTLAAHEH